MKAPFVTNSLYLKRYTADALSTVQAINNIRKDLLWLDKARAPSCYLVPYVMIQPRVEDNREAKLVFIDRKFFHISSHSSRLVVQKLPGITQEEMIDFATDALDALHDSGKSVILDGVVRVDILKGNDGRLVVNEFESLEARRFTLNTNHQHNVNAQIILYWEQKAYDCLNSLREEMTCVVESAEDCDADSV